jgi:SAM-dependent methyltransferase
MNEEFASSIPAGSLVLDAGAGNQPYRKLFEHCRYESADFEMVDKPYARSTYVCNLESIPVEDGRFDAIVMNQVIEHLPQPLAVLKELHRVLKPGGTMICSGPLFYEEHEQPYDYYRFTQFGWRYLMEKSGFSLLTLEWLEGYFGTVAYQLHTASRYLPGRTYGVIPGPVGLASTPIVFLSKFTFRLLARLFYILDERAKFTEGGFPKNYVVVVQRPIGAANASTRSMLA